MFMYRMNPNYSDDQNTSDFPAGGGLRAHKRRRARQSKAPYVILGLFLAAALLAVCILAVQLRRAEQDMEELRTGNDLYETERKIEELTAQMRSLEKERDELKAQAAELTADRERLINDFSDSDSVYRELNEKLNALDIALSERDEEITMLKSSIDKLEAAYSIDLNRQLTLIQELEELLANGPALEKKVRVTQADGTTVEQVEAVTPTVSLYYEDIENGYKYSYNGDAVYSSASCIKAPYALSLLLGAEEELASLAGVDLSTVDRFYDFEGKSIVYDSATMSKPGTGRIKDGENGATYTYLQLIEYMLAYSDNVAYDQLKAAFDMTRFRSMVYSMNLSSMKKSLSNMSAEDGGKIMRAIYDYIHDGYLYSDFLYRAMLNSAHTVMIGTAVRPAQIVHKYGWDTGAYHDMAIVYDTHPYILVFMSDMDTGGSVVNEYVQSVVAQVVRLHHNFYETGLNKQ